MFEVNIAVMLVVCLIVLVAMGVHIAISLGMTSALGIFFTTGADSYAFETVQLMKLSAHMSLRLFHYLC